METRDIALAGLFGALYAVGVILLAPISFLPVQVRIADAFLPLSILFGLPVIIGLTLGALVANLVGGLGAVDVIGGSIANLIATTLAWKIGSLKFRGTWLAAVAVEILVVTIIVGTYLSILFEIPIVVGLMDVFVGSLIAIGIAGYSLLKLLEAKPMLTQR